MVFPLMLLLTAIALIALDMDANAYSLELPNAKLPALEPFPINTVIVLMLMTLSGFLVRNLIPLKSPAGLKAFATACGIGIPFVFLQGYLPFMDNPMLNFAGSSLMVSSWMFQLYGQNKGMIWTMASGITGGLACSISPVCLSGVIPLLFFSFFHNSPSWKNRCLHLLVWILFLIVGLIPALTMPVPLEAYRFTGFNPEIIKAGFIFSAENAPLWSWVFVLIGLVVSLLQRQPILLGLILPSLLLRLIFAGTMTTSFWAPDSTLLLPFAWLTAYGMLRVLRGIEQGVRNVDPKQAKMIPAIGTAIFVVGFSLKLASLFYIVA